MPRGGRGGASHRHRTLVLNSATGSGSGSGQPSNSSATTYVPGTGYSAENDGTTLNGWVAKRDRHMQLINSAIYDKEAQTRAKAMEESRKVKAEKQAQVEQAKVLSYAQGVGRPQFPPAAATAAAAVPRRTTAAAQPAGYQIFFNDIPFRIGRGGSKLIRVSSAIPFVDAMNDWRTGLPGALDDPNTANNTPKKVSVAGVMFVRGKNGNLHRLGAVTSKRWLFLCLFGRKILTMSVGNLRRSRRRMNFARDLLRRVPFPQDGLLYLYFFTSWLLVFTDHWVGTCYKGPSCLYVHDPNKVAICKEFLHGKCSAGIGCDLSHEPSPHRSPTCMHFLRGHCANPECPYAHVRVTPGAPVCRDFATLGYCEKGAECEERHVHECPDYANTGFCNKKRCRLPHVDRAGQIRKNAAIKAESTTANEDEGSDASSEEEEYDEIDSDDVDSDSDDESEFIAKGGVDSGELSQQQDFVRF